MKYGLQMYSVRDVTKTDLRSAMKQVAEMGYSFVEYAGFFGHPANEVAQWQRELGLECSGTHSDWNDLRPDKIEETIRYHKEIGNHNYIIPGANLSSLDRIAEFASVVNAAAPVLAENGISLAYHNHSGEFIPQEWGGTIYEELEKRCDIGFEIDTFWAFNAGLDPVAMMERLKDRVRVIHLKDGLRGGVGKALGEGEAPVREVRRKAIELGMTIVVESEGLSPTGPGEVGRCIAFLKKLDAEDGL